MKKLEEIAERRTAADRAHAKAEREEADAFWNFIKAAAELGLVSEVDEGKAPAKTSKPVSVQAAERACLRTAEHC